KLKRLTRAGHRALALGKGQQAVRCFREALLLSEGTANPQLRRVCAYHLGAAYVESGKPRKGLEFLLQCQPWDGQCQEELQDLSFSLRAAQEGLQDFPKALPALEPTLGHAQLAQAGTQAEMGCCYLGMKDPARAAHCFLEAAGSYKEAANPEGTAVALSRASSAMLQSQEFGAAEILGVLARCHSLCGAIPDPSLRGKLYSEIGLSYAQLHLFSLASESFQQALALCSPQRHRRREAALAQNLGAAHNALGSFGTALGWHQRAVALHGALGNRRAQGQCFGNLAHACCQLGNYQGAAQNYLHALQAFRDTGDLQGQWLACEGLGASWCQLGDPQQAVGHYKEAL
ncbi:TTC24 protein, partial [Tricholaema leucomelas]|nr:TTC24 protein [Tricholaema leucomelas]